MITTTKKDILTYLNKNNNLNGINYNDVKELDLETIALSFGSYGMNAGLFISKKTGLYYVCPSRSTMLFRLA